jgi:hypothetical protein
MSNDEIIKTEGPPICVQWQAREFEKRNKNAKWFLSVAFGALIFITISLMMQNFIFAFLLILIVFTLFIYALKDPRLINFKIDEEGIWIDEKLYPFEELKSFWVFCRPPVKELSLHSKKWLLPFIKIPLGQQDCAEIRELLTQVLPEEKQEESTLDNVAKFLKF